MFSKKNIVDVKKSTSKIQDSKKESSTRLKHLKLLLENVDTAESKGFFEANFSHVYHILYDSFIQAETNLKQRVHKAHKEELELCLWLLHKVLTLLPELLNRGWQLHSLSRILQKMLHLQNSTKLRREAIRYFLLWYQALGDNSPEFLHSLFASLVPGFPNQSISLLQSGSTHSSVFHDTNVQNPVTAVELTPLLPPSSGEKSIENGTRFYLEALLEYMVSTVIQLEWHDRSAKQHKCFQFLLEKFKIYYLPYICPNFNYETSIYKPNLDLPLLRKPEPETDIIPSRVVLIKWIAQYTHITKKSNDVQNPLTPSISTSSSQNTSMEANAAATEEEHIECKRISYSQDSQPNLDPNSFLKSQEQISEEQLSTTVVRDVFYSTRENVNFIHEIYRQAFYLNFTHPVAIRKAIAVYKDLIQMNYPELPNYMLEPLECGSKDEAGLNMMKVEDELSAESYRQTRLRNDSYLGAIHRENLYVRAGLQNVLRVFMTHAAGVFLVQIPSHCSTSLEEQTDACKRVLNIYRYMVMHTRMDSHTWEQLLMVLLQITSLVLTEAPPKKKEHTLGGKLAPAIFQTLIVTWIKANLNVIISRELWDRFLNVLISLTQWEDLIKEWAKTMDTLTRVLARHVYGLDLTNLPLDRLSEQKTKKSRRGTVRTSAKSESYSKSESETNTLTPNKSDDCTTPEVILNQINSSGRKHKLNRSSSENALFISNRSKQNKTPHKSRPSNVTNIPTLPSTIEQQINKLIAQSQNISTKIAKYNFGIRKAVSLDSIPTRCRSLSERINQDDLSDRSRSPSPAPSSGVENTSIKDTPMQIDMLGGDSGSIETGSHSTSTNSVGNSVENCGVICGGTVRGWLPDVAVILWRRMLAALGDPNRLSDPRLHAMMFEYLVQLTDTLIKISQNQGVSLDNMGTPPPPELIPPITLIIPWCLGALTLPSEKYRVGRLNAHRLLATITANCNPIHRNHLTFWFKELHKGLCSNDRATVDIILQHLGPRFLSLNLPGQSILLLDLIHACSVVLSSKTLTAHAPRTEAVSILGDLLSLPPTISTLPVLEPDPTKFNISICPDLKEHIVSVLLRVGRREPTAQARCVALSSLGIFVYRELANGTNHPKVKEAITVLLLALKFNNKAIAQVATDVLLLLCDYTTKLSRSYPTLPYKIVSTISTTLAQLVPSEQSALPVSEKDKSLITSLLLCLGEWCMRLGPKKLLEKNAYADSEKDKCLLLTVFQVLFQMITGDTSEDKGLTQPNFHEDFDPNILIDNLSSTKGSNISSSSNKSQQYNLALKLCARMVLTHLVTHLGHFPMAIGAGGLSSLVVESDDVPDLHTEELSTQIFTIPTVQLFMFNENTLASLIELPALELPGGGVTAGLITAKKQVRILLRDLAGKSSWDSSVLYRSPDHLNPTSMLSASSDTLRGVPGSYSLLMRNNNLSIGDSLMIAPSAQIIQPQRALRHRPPHVLPDVTNAAPDLDQLDDLLQYLGHTSPECLQRAESCLNESAPAPFSVQQEQEIISTVLSHRNAEVDYNTNIKLCQDEQLNICIPPISNQKHSPFQHCRLLFSQLGFTGWERRKQCYLLSKNEKLLRELRNLDSQRCRETHKVAIIYVGTGQEDKNSILSNVCGSSAYEQFISSLAWEVELESHAGFMGGLQRQGTNGDTAPYYATSFVEVIFHVATRMPSDNQEAILNKTRHLGNDEVHIIWSEHNREYRRGIIPTEFCDILIVIYPIGSGLCRVTINRKPDVPFFGPLFDESIVEISILAGLIRSTAISASRAKRTILPFYQQYYEERARSIDTVVSKHKESTTFEEFAARVYSPTPTASPCCPIGNSSGACTGNSLDQSTNNLTPTLTLAAALLDHSHTHRITLRQHTEHKFYSRTSDTSKGVWFNNSESSHSSDSSDIALHHGISPRPFKKLSNTFKNVPRRTFHRQDSTVQAETPPESPVLTTRRGKHN